MISVWSEQYQSVHVRCTHIGAPRDGQPIGEEGTPGDVVPREAWRGEVGYGAGGRRGGTAGWGAARGRGAGEGHGCGRRGEGLEDEGASGGKEAAVSRMLRSQIRTSAQAMRALVAAPPGHCFPTPRPMPVRP